MSSRQCIPTGRDHDTYSFCVWLCVNVIEVFYTCKFLSFTEKSYRDDYGELSPVQPDSLVLMLSRFFIYYYTLQINRTERTMENHLHFNQILLVLMLPVIVTQATFVQNTFEKLEPGQNITGKIGAEIKARSRQECAVRQVSTALEY